MFENNIIKKYKKNNPPTHWDDDRGYDMNFLHYTGGGNKVIMLEDYKNNKFKYLKSA